MSAMQIASWQYRPWKLPKGDFGDWAHWLYFMPGDALIALIGPTALGEFLELSPASFGSTTSAWLSALLWVCAICAAYYLYGFLLDCVDPTYRVQQRERRQAYGSGTMLAAFRRSGFGARIDRVTPRQRG